MKPLTETNTNTMNEQEMREHTVPTFNKIEELTKYIEDLREQEHDYGTAVYAMSLAAVATYNYIANVKGVTGFQASCAYLDIIRRTRRIEGPFMILKLNDALYPQYDIPARVVEFLDGGRTWLKTEATKLLKNKNDAHPDVIAHWEKLAAYEPLIP